MLIRKAEESHALHGEIEADNMWSKGVFIFFSFFFDSLFLIFLTFLLPYVCSQLIHLCSDNLLISKFKNK